jgi:hypothetical protein
MSNIYTAAILGVCKLSTAGTSPTPLCRKFSGGSFSIDPHNSINEGGGGIDLLRKGTSEITVNLTCAGLASSDVALFFPTTRTTQVASFPGLLVELDDGTIGAEWVLTGGQPASITVSCGDGADAQVEYQLTMKYATAATVARGTFAASYNSYKSHTVNEAYVTVGGSAVGSLSWEVSNDLGCEMHNPMDAAKSANSRTLPNGYYITQSRSRVQIVSSNLLHGVDQALADDWTAANIIVALANGVTDENVTFTASTFVRDNAFELPLSSGGRIGFSNEFRPDSGQQWGRIAIS